MKVLFDLEDLSIHRSGVHILDGVNWQVKSGEHWVILGANGSGKTSLLKALTGYMMPTRGEITLLGEEYGGSDWRELRKRIGVVSSSISHLVHDDDSGLEIVVGGSQAMIGFWAESADRSVSVPGGCSHCCGFPKPSGAIGKCSHRASGSVFSSRER